MDLISASSTAIYLIKFVLWNALRFGLLLVILVRVIKELKLKNDFSVDLIKSIKITSIMLIILSLINANEPIISIVLIISFLISLCQPAGIIGMVIAIISLIFTINSKKSVESNAEKAALRLKWASLFNIIAVLLIVIGVLFGDMI